MTFPASTIKSYFQTNDKPTQAQFEEFIDGVADIDANAPLSNFDAVVDPTTGDDTNDGYSAGSRWVNTVSNESFECTDAAAGAAVWKSTTATTGIADGDKGDITVSGTGTVWTIDALAVNSSKLAANAVTTAKILDDNVTLDKISNLTANRLLGSDGSGNPSEITISGATLSAGVLTIPSASAGVHAINRMVGDGGTSTSSTFTDLSGHTISITPETISKKVRIRANVTLGWSTAPSSTSIGGLRITRSDGTVVGTAGVISDAAGNAFSRCTIEVEDAPATTSTMTYKVQYARFSGTTGAINNPNYGSPYFDDIIAYTID